MLNLDGPKKNYQNMSLMISLSFIDFWNTSDTESEVDLQLSTGGMDQDDDDFDFYD